MSTESKPLTFGELEEGAKFISFPEDGDDAGHGGYRGGAYLFVKLRKTTLGAEGENAVKCMTGAGSHMPDSMPVYLILT